MKAFKNILILFTIISLTSCSYMFSDFEKMTKGVKYTVEHYQEIVAEYGTNSEEQINGKKDEHGILLSDEYGKPQLDYDLFETQVLYGEPGRLSEAVARTYNGFTAQTIEQRIIEEDESTVIKVYYNRNLVTMTACIGEGIWNYADKKADPSLEDDSENKTLTRKYGSHLNSEIMNSMLSKAGKMGCTLTKWVLSDGTETSILPLSFPASDVTYTAIWEAGKPANYTIVHYFEKLECTDNTQLNETNYQINVAYSQVKSGQPEYQTETQDCALNVPGFIAKDHSEQEISASGSTVVAIYYVRDSFDIKLSTDDGLWNYDLWKADKEHVTQNSSEKTLSGRFGATVDYSAIAALKKTGMDLYGWKKPGSDSVIKTEDLPKTYQAENQSYTAVWTKKKAVSYEVKYLTENLDSTNSENPANYTQHSSDKSKTGIPEYYTDVTAITIPGFTAKEIEQQEIQEDGSTVVQVYYKRDTFTLTIDPNGGYWNYDAYKAARDTASPVTPDSKSIEISGKFEAPVVIPSLTGLGKRSQELTGWKDLVSGMTYEIDGLAAAFTSIPSKDITLTAQWKKGQGVEYTVKHWLEKVDSTGSQYNTNYTEDELLRQIELGEEAGDKTEAVEKTLQGFTLRETPVQKTIKADGSTVVDIYYTRNSSSFIFNGNGGTVDGEDTITGKYEAAFDPDDTPTATKAGWTFGGWTLNNKLVTNEALQLANQTYGLTDKTFKAYWVSMVSVGGKSTFTDITLTRIQTETNVTCTVTLPAGYEGETWLYKWYVDGVYTSDEVELSRSAAALGVGVHTITVKASMNGQNFTKQITATIN